MRLPLVAWPGGARFGWRSWCGGMTPSAALRDWCASASSRVAESRCGRVGKCVANSPHCPTHRAHTLPMSFKSRLVTVPSLKFFAKHYYPFITRISGDDLVFMNWGYEEDPPMTLPLEGSD